MKNREKIYKSITHAAVSDSQNHSRPSTSNNYSSGVIVTDKDNGALFSAHSHSASSTSINCSTEAITVNKDDESTHTEVEWNDFADDFQINDQDLAKIDQLHQSEVPESSAPAFTTAKNKKVLVSLKRSTLAKHFTTKPSISVSFKGSENEPPLKKSKMNEETNILQPVNSADQEAQNNTDVNSAFNENSSIKYENCVF